MGGRTRKSAKGEGTAPKKPAKKAAGGAGCLGRLARVGLGLAGAGVLLGAVASGVGWFLYQEHVIRDPGPHLDRSHIQAIIVQDSPVYYRDGKTRLGVFFDDEHREFLGWEELPHAWVTAIVAAEDDEYWSHQGISPLHIARAMVNNAQSGEVVAGGSTLTQQTAKNLYYRPDRSLKSKWTELVNALRLEAHYDKTEILTFYANQFHVSGNGRGLGIAARYFFDKPVEQLTVAECAFLGGLVKAPSYYDPFVGDADKRQRALDRANDRTRYVLGRMVGEPAEKLAGPFPKKGDAAAEAAYAARVAEVRKEQAEAQRALDAGAGLSFKRGAFRYDSSAVLDEVARRLHEPPFDDVLKKAGIDDPDTAGLVIVTTLDPDAQREATYGLWHHLTEVGAWMEGLGPKAFVRADGRGPHLDPNQRLVPHEFRVARVTGRLSPGDKAHLAVDLGGVACTVDRDAVVRAAAASYRGLKKDKNAKVPSATVDEFLAAIPDGAVVWTSIRGMGPGGVALCDLEVKPELQGAVMVLESGEVRAMVGGNDNRNFNRATALRQFGSTWKPLVYHAALKLGWSPTDELDNGRNVFPFSTTFYYPRPDHAPNPVVSMSWAGVNSENLASVWLLYHLADRLNGEQVRALAESLGMARAADESVPAYRVRMQKAGVMVTPRRVEESHFLQTRQEVLTGLALEGHPEDALALQSMLYGWGFDAEIAAVESSGGGDRGWKRHALGNTWRELSTKMESCATQHARLADALDRRELPPPTAIPDLTVLKDASGLQVACGAIPQGYVRPDESVLDGAPPAEPDRPDGPQRRGWWDRVTGGAERPVVRLGGGSRLAEPEDVLVDDRVHLGTLRALEAGMRRRGLARQAAGAQAPDLYDPEVLYWQQDFRVLLAIEYVVALAGEYGVRTELQKVLSLPLGASEITLEEAASVYEGITTGKAWDFPGKVAGTDVGPPTSTTLLIKEIRDVDGNVIYRADPTPREVAPATVADMTSDILRNIVLYGTGTRAKDAVKIDDLSVPLGGKTGTTNDFRNAAFVGFAPVHDGAAFRVDHGFTVAAYVGYDDNRSMSVGNIKLAGASGALPAWIATVEGLRRAGLLGTPSGKPAGAPWWPLQPASSDLVRVPVDGETGRVLAEGGEVTDPRAQSVLTVREAKRPPEVAVRVHRFPIRIAPRTEDASAEAETRRRRREERAKGRPSVWDSP